MSLPLARYRFSVDDYYRLAQAGILGEDDRVELIEGEILMMPPIDSRHAACVSGISRLMLRALGEQAVVRVRCPARLDDLNEPEPDLCLARPRADLYSGAHPGPADVLLLIEVADSSIGYDRGIKLPLYARSGIAAVWILDLGRRLVEAYSGPSPDGYLERRTLRSGDRLEIPGTDVSIDAGQLFPI
ncbi:MAG TPA: Uma2 family endonuclease [Thermoanaerobaculia bacterium]|nr:Uma2 family endonuclease [Thermoanaerobaculia bacterium]